MEYRDQLKYIKSHQIEGGSPQKRNNRRRKRKEEPRRREQDRLDRGRRSDSSRRPDRSRQQEPQAAKAGALNRAIWLIQAVSSVFFVGSMLLLGILPLKYLIALLVILVLLLIAVRLRQRRTARRKGKRGGGRGLSLAASVLLVVLGLYSLKVNAALDEIAVGEESGGYDEEHALDLTEEPFNVYISGIDVYGEITQKSRSDVNLIATINPKTHKILLTTTPRDYYIQIPGVSEGQNDKLTHAGLYGIDTSIATLENLYETEIPFYVRVNFTSVEEIVDVMGGIDVDSQVAFTTSKAAGAVVDVQEGKNHFNGKEALAFVRERKAFVDGDNQRGKNQQALLSALIKKAVSPMILFRANGMINSVTGNAQTNMSEAQIKSLIRMQLADMKGWDIESVAATGDDSTKQYCYSYSGAPLYVTVPDWGSVEEIKGKMQETLGK